MRSQSMTGIARRQMTSADRYKRLTASLPPQSLLLRNRTSFEHYGASRLAAHYCGFDNTPYIPNIRWQHGWAPKERQEVDTLFVLQETHLAPDSHYLVAREDEVRFLQSQQLTATAVGLPFVYTHTHLTRIPNSLLVMPGHSLADVTRSWKCHEYVAAIKQVAKDFDFVAACIHPACRSHGYWEPEFIRAGIPVIEGAQSADVNGLNRMRAIFEQFTHMTTNSVGSHVPYAAACNSKVSVFGPYAHVTHEDYKDSALFRGREEFLDLFIAFASEEKMKSLFPFLFRSPCDAADHCDWARIQLGWNNRKSPAELRDILRWDRSTIRIKAICNLADACIDHLNGAGRSVRKLARHFLHSSRVRSILKGLVKR